MQTEKIIITHTLNQKQKNQVSSLYFQAFPAKFSAIWVFTKDEEKAVSLLTQSINFSSGLYAISNKKVLGFIGLETGNNYYTNFKLKAFTHTFGIIQGTLRHIGYHIYRIFHGKTPNNSLHIDPIAVSSEARGMGIGTKLFKATFKYAQILKKESIILEVVDTNPRAQNLYEKLGFTVKREENTRLLTKRANFEKVIHMEKRLSHK